MSCDHKKRLSIRQPLVTSKWTRLHNCFNLFLGTLLIFVISTIILNWLGAKNKALEIDNKFIYTEQLLFNSRLKIDELLKSKRLCLLFFSTKCPACSENVSFWNKVYESSSINMSMLALCEGDTSLLKRYINLFEIKYPVGLNANARNSIFAKNGINFVPTAIIVNENNEIEKIWKGVLDSNKQMDIIKTFNYYTSK